MGRAFGRCRWQHGAFSALGPGRAAAMLSPNAFSGVLSRTGLCLDLQSCMFRGLPTGLMSFIPPHIRQIPEFLKALASQSFYSFLGGVAFVLEVMTWTPHK